LRLVSFIIFK